MIANVAYDYRTQDLVVRASEQIRREVRPVRGKLGSLFAAVKRVRGKVRTALGRVGRRLRSLLRMRGIAPDPPCQRLAPPALIFVSSGCRHVGRAA